MHRRQVQVKHNRLACKVCVYLGSAKGMNFVCRGVYVCQAGTRSRSSMAVLKCVYGSACASVCAESVTLCVYVVQAIQRSAAQAKAQRLALLTVARGAGEARRLHDARARHQYHELVAHVALTHNLNLLEHEVVTEGSEGEMWKERK